MPAISSISTATTSNPVGKMFTYEHSSIGDLTKAPRTDQCQG